MVKVIGKVKLEYYSFMLNHFFETLFIQLMAIIHRAGLALPNLQHQPTKMRPETRTPHAPHVLVSGVWRL